MFVAMQLLKSKAFWIFTLVCGLIFQESFASDTIPNRKPIYNLRLMRTHGEIGGFTNKPNTYPFDLSENLDGIGDQTENSIEASRVLFSFFNLGIGYGVINRWGSAIAHQHDRADKIYAIAEVSGLKVRIPLSVNFQAGYTQGIMLDKKIYFYGIGTKFHCPFTYHRFNFSLYYFSENYSGEKIDKHSDNFSSGVSYHFDYTLTYTIHIDNYGVVVQYNFFKK